MKRTYSIVTMLMCFPAILLASSAGDVRSGIKAYTRGDYEQSLSKFRQAQISSPDNPVVHFDIGDASYKNNNYDESSAAFQKALAAKSKDIRSQAYYNLGNAAYRKGDSAQALENYKKALALNPRDRDAKYNIEYLLFQPKQKQKKNDKNDKNNKKNEKDKDQQKNAATDNRKGMNKDDAERILQVFNEHDQQSAKRRKMQMPKIPKTDEDW